MRGFVVKLSNGEIFSESEITWIELKSYVQEKDLRIAEMYLQFDHQKVHLPNYARVYFYSKKVEAYVGASHGQKQYYGVGASHQSQDEVVITWYDGENVKEENRAVEDKAAFIKA